MTDDKHPDRRDIVKGVAATAVFPGLAGLTAPGLASASMVMVDDFQRADGSDAGDAWEGLNPGYWRIENGRLRRRLKAVGDRARATGFPYHYETGVPWLTDEPRVMPVDYDPSLPLGILWNRHWRLTGSYSIALTAEIIANTPAPAEGDDPSWRMYSSEQALIGLAFAGNTQFEGWRPARQASPLLIVRETGHVSIARYNAPDFTLVSQTAQARIDPLRPGDRLTLAVEVAVQSGQPHVRASVTVNGRIAAQLVWAEAEDLNGRTGFFGIAARGLMDVAVADVSLMPGTNEAQDAPVNECLVCYALGDTLRREGDRWHVRFVALFRSAGDLAALRLSDAPNPPGGWATVEPAGHGAIVSNDFRHHTAIIEAVLPFDPARRTLYFTVWKDGRNVTADPRIGTASTGPGTGLVGDVPASGRYIGRLPRLAAPYRLCGLSCHAIGSLRRSALPDSGRPGDYAHPYYIHDQPAFGSFRHLEEHDYQIMLWEDDVWYLEAILFPPSTEDAYNIIALSIAGPTTRWQMMRHWNVINPGDHEYGMDDVKGPEQILLRNRDDLGQDPDYMRRNFQLVEHLSRGIEDPSATDNPKRWRKWTMPDGDFSLLILDGRLWRSSQDTNIWDDQGWGHVESLYSRRDPTRTLLGEEQFAWLERQIRTDPAMLICATGLNALHTVWSGWGEDGWNRQVNERDRVSADYAGWVAAGADRVLDLFARRGGVVSVYGDVHAGCILRNTDHRLYECAFGPIGRYGARQLIEGFGRHMTDWDGRAVEILALYHDTFEGPDLTPVETPDYWNVLDMVFDPRGVDPVTSLLLRNIADGPDDPPRGGARVDARAEDMGRVPDAALPAIKTLANADILFLNAQGEPLRGARSLDDGTIAVTGLTGVRAGETVTVLARRGSETYSMTVAMR